jgi:6-phosphofructokinase 1
MLTPADLAVATLGPCRHHSPLRLSTVEGDGIGNFVPDDTRVLCNIEHRVSQPGAGELSFERAGARQWLFFDPPRTKAAIVTCGGLCPGMNNIIRGAYFELHSNYGVPEVLGIRYGFEGLNPRAGHTPQRLSGEFVEQIAHVGGTVLGTSRGAQDVGTMVDTLARERIDILLCIGGDGTQRGAHAIAEEARRRGLPISVVGIPKTIDNDIAFVSRSFGFDTAIATATQHILGAHNEAIGVRNGIGLVKLMGRQAGFIAATATIASAQVNFCLVPEVPFELAGEQGFLTRLHRRLLARGHAVVVVAEGAGQHLLGCTPQEFDASGNPKLGDIGTFLKERIKRYLEEVRVPTSIKYFDPSYHVRSMAANCQDSVLCNRLAARAVHAAMAGKTDVLVGLAHDTFIHVPLPAVTGSQKRISPESDLWMDVLAATAQEKW